MKLAPSLIKHILQVVLQKEHFLQVPSCMLKMGLCAPFKANCYFDRFTDPLKRSFSRLIHGMNMNCSIALALQGSAFLQLVTCGRFFFLRRYKYITELVLRY